MNHALSPTPTGPPWPAPPRATAAVGERLAWYAAVARWAPSKHNTQPWRFVVRGGALEVWADPTRVLADSDPYRRELIISCGAAVHLACVAARSLGHKPVVTLLPEGEGGFLARLVEVGDWTTSDEDHALLDIVPLRRTDRGPLDATELPSLPFLLQSAAAVEGASFRIVGSPGDRATLANLIERADRILVQRGAVDSEMQEWLRTPGDPRRDGVPTDHTRGPAASYRARYVQRDFSTHTSVPGQDRAGVDDPVVGVLCTTGDREIDWLVAGRALAAILLRAALLGAHASYLNQPVEEQAVRSELRNSLGLDGQAQLVLRLGRGAPVAATSRRNPDELVFNAQKDLT